MSQVARFLLSCDDVSEMQRRGVFLPGNFDQITPTLSIDEQRKIMGRILHSLKQSTLDIHAIIKEMKKKNLPVPPEILREFPGFQAFVQMHERLRARREAAVASNLEFLSSIAFAQAAVREPPKIDFRLSAAFCDGMCITAAVAKAHLDNRQTAKGAAKTSGAQKSPEKYKDVIEKPVQEVVIPPPSLNPKSARVKMDFQKLAGGAVMMCGSVLYPENFKDWRDQNGNSHFVHMLSSILHNGTRIWRIGFSNGTYSRFHDVDSVLDSPRISTAKRVVSLHKYQKQMYALAWLARPGVTPPPLTVSKQPGEAVSFP
jgi:hypothetical protein